MKKTIFIIALFLVYNAHSQSHVVIGDWEWIDAMFYFEVTDSHNGEVMSGVKVELFDGRVKVASVYTNHRGAALFVIKGVKHLESNMTFKVEKESYSTWSQTLESQYDVLQYMKKNQIGIRYKNNQGLNRLRKPTSRTEDIAHILNGNFEKGSGLAASYSGKGPGMMQFQVSLKYDRHPKDKQYHKVDNSYSQINQSTSSNYRGKNTSSNTIGDPFTAMAKEDGNDDDYKGWKFKMMTTGLVTFTRGKEVVSMYPWENKWETSYSDSNRARSLGIYSTMEEAGFTLKRYMDKKTSMHEDLQKAQNKTISINEKKLVNKPNNNYKGWIRTKEDEYKTKFTKDGKYIIINDYGDNKCSITISGNDGSGFDKTLIRAKEGFSFKEALVQAKIYMDNPEGYSKKKPSSWTDVFF